MNGDLVKKSCSVCGADMKGLMAPDASRVGMFFCSDACLLESGHMPVDRQSLLILKEIRDLLEKIYQRGMVQ